MVIMDLILAIIVELAIIGYFVYRLKASEAREQSFINLNETLRDILETRKKARGTISVQQAGVPGVTSIGDQKG